MQQVRLMMTPLQDTGTFSCTSLRSYVKFRELLEMCVQIITLRGSACPASQVISSLVVRLLEYWQMGREQETGFANRSRLMYRKGTYNHPYNHRILSLLLSRGQAANY